MLVVKLGKLVRNTMFGMFSVCSGVVCPFVNTLCKYRVVVNIGSLRVIVDGADTQMETGTCPWLRYRVPSDSPVREE